jgi:hypothetical protein
MLFTETFNWSDIVRTSLCSKDNFALRDMGDTGHTLGSPLYYQFCSMLFLALEILKTSISKTSVNHGNTPWPKRYTLIAWPTPNQLTPNPLHPLHNTQGHRQTCLSRPSIPHFLHDSNCRQWHKKNRPAISDASPHPFSSCGGATNIFSRSHGRESIADETAALEWSK